MDSAVEPAEPMKVDTAAANTVPVECGNCSDPCVKPLRCGVCKTASYCCKKCQQEDWQYHKRNCKAAKSEPESSLEERAKQAADAKQAMDEELANTDPKVAAQVKDMMAKMGYDTGAEKKDAQEETKAKPAPNVPKADMCKNCMEPCATTLRCSVCKVATYCSRNCQREDWNFHKRNCKKPLPKAEASNYKPESYRPKADEKVVEDDGEVGDWYRHREWRPEKKVEFKPSKVDAEGATVTKSEGGSAWNAAGTWEERDMLPWWKNRLLGLTGLAVDSFAGKLTVTNVTDVNGEAQILHVRKSSKYIFDINFCVEFSCGFATSSRSTSGKVKVLELANVTVKDGTKLPVEISAESDSDKRAAETALVPALEARLQEYITEYQAQDH